MFNKYQLKLVLDSGVKINFENYYKADLITIIEILLEEKKKLEEKIKRENTLKEINKQFKNYE